jgi:hypothetical protein
MVVRAVDPLTESQKPPPIYRTSLLVVVSQQIANFVIEFLGLLFSLLPRGVAVVAVVLIGIERQKGGNQDRQDYYNGRPHR